MALFPIIKDSKPYVTNQYVCVGGASFEEQDLEVIGIPPFLVSR